MDKKQNREVDQTLDLAAGLSASWIDEDLSWNPSSYGNAQDIVVPLTDVWTPKFLLVNSVATYEPLGGDNANFATLENTGEVAIFVSDVLSSKCTTNIYKFPFDSQTCYLRFFVLSMTSKTVTLNPASNPVQLSFFTPNSDWSLQSYKDVQPFTNDCEGENMKSWTETSPSWKDVCEGLDNIVMVISYNNIDIRKNKYTPSVIKQIQNKMKIDHTCVPIPSTLNYNFGFPQPSVTFPREKDDDIKW
ncbi:unnamed protein product [Mytilus edulis]|uniref:Neurotransmitter-gated ion-channel ligand-binding domain-containing protein n=1 Tax=Mytilus edulis TaxID=6550 RepID=A0A8S3T7V3_MYTED|nr:unnamed protein product [Mytilus edulis]